MNESQLVEAVRATVRNERNKIAFDAAIVEAMRLADLYESIKPTDYILPLDAMAGLPSPAFKA